ncbi:DUF4178 domain-containing protein [Tropicimonas sp.]|uniref:DUF4178 domain-containing protein n=1 Tax=Tropicimonas sp. TaxID=2067044 RepID=UPI003A8C368B
MTATIRAINCPGCGAGQDVFGGGRVLTQICPYCGSALDALDDFRVITRYSGLKRPESPLSLGDQGRIAGVDFTVIGTIGWMERHRGESWHWTDHQVYSPTHGYAWITLEDGGDLTFTRRLRAMPRNWLSPTMVERAEYRPSVTLGGRRYAYYETSTARIDFLEGAFNWKPAIGDSTTTVSLIAEGAMLDLSEGKSEREVELTRLMSGEEIASFGITPPHAATASPLRLRPAWPHMAFLRRMALLFAVLSLAALVAAWVSGGVQLAGTGQIRLADLPAEVAVSVPKGARLLRAVLRSDVDNGWAWFDLELEDSGGVPVLAAGREISFYHGVDSDGRWSEGSLSGGVTFVAPPPGDYRLSVEMSEAGSGEFGADVTNSWVSIDISAPRFSAQPLIVAVAVFAAIAVGTVIADASRRRRLLAGSDWSEE